MSVRANNDSLRVTIKDPSVSRRHVQTLAREYESIQRCEITGDILCGGNRYVSVQHSRDAMHALTAIWTPAVERAAAKLPGYSSSLIRVERTPYYLGRPPNHYGLTVWDGVSFQANVSNVEDAAYWIGCQMA